MRVLNLIFLKFQCNFSAKSALNQKVGILVYTRVCAFVYKLAFIKVFALKQLKIKKVEKVYTYTRVYTYAYIDIYTNLSAVALCTCSFRRNYDI